MKNRTLVLIGAGLVATALAFGGLTTALAQTPGPAGQFGPGYGFGPGMMRAGYGYGPGGMMGRGGVGTNTPLTSIPEAQKAFQAYVDRTGNADLALDDVMQFQQNFYAIVKEKSSGRGAFELLADKQTGAVFPEIGPNMMWNTKYGHMAGLWQQPGQQTITADRAKDIAQQWLDANQPGSTLETPDVFYGYYTVHILKDGGISGMLSVNAFTGQVWYHTWHGAFIGSNESGD
jgi:hypothetical protein